MSQRTDLCAATMQGSVYVRWQLCFSDAAVHCAYAVACCYAVAMSLLEVILLAILDRLDANPQSVTVDHE
jgi:hypothetical protein